MNKILLTGIVSALFLICSSSSSVFAQENPSQETMDHITVMGIPLEILVAIAHWLTGSRHYHIGSCHLYDISPSRGFY